MIKLSHVILLFLFGLINLGAQEFNNSKIESYLDNLPNSTSVGIMIYDPLSKDTIFSKNSDELHIPASNIKLFTTATALDLLGKDFELKTILGTTDSNFTDGQIDGDLILKGFGNSLFTEENLDSLISTLKEYGITQITGNVLGDDTFFDNIYSRDDWIIDEKANVPLPPVSALVLDRNGFLVSVDATKSPGSKVNYTLKPDMDFYDVEVSAKVVKFKRTPKVSSRFGDSNISLRISGGARQRKYPYNYKLNADNPALYAAFTLYDKVAKSGIRIIGSPTTALSNLNFYPISESSTKLVDLIPIINKNSDNFLAECLFKSLGAYYSNKVGNSFYATQAVMDYLDRKEIPNYFGLSIVDGSGISRFNEVTVSAITNLLESVYVDIDKYEIFKNSLSIAGVDGTLGRRFARSELRNHFFGKTGTLNGVTSLSGYLETKSGKEVIVSILMQFRDKGASYHKEIQNDILEYLYERY